MRRAHARGGRPATLNLAKGAPRSGTAAGITMTQAFETDDRIASIGPITVTGPASFEVRAAAPATPATGGRAMAQHVTGDEVPGTAIRRAERGADAAWTTPGRRAVGRLAAEGPCVRDDPGPPRRSPTRIGVLRIAGKAGADAMHPRAVVGPLGDAGTFSVEFEWVEAQALGDISGRSGLVTRSIGAGSGGNIILPFMQDICGDVGNPPRRPRATGEREPLPGRLHPWQPVHR